MPESRGKHLARQDRDIIESGIRDGDSARKIARELGVSASTVTREVKANRMLREKKAERGAKLSVRCVLYKDCQASATACKGCLTRLTTCKSCKTRSCIDTCPDFTRLMCPTTDSWPYVCLQSCPKRGYCGYPKCSYGASDADASYRKRLISAREGIDVTPEELEAMNALVAPLVKKGQSFEAIWATHARELPVGIRTAYNYQEAGILATADIELPRKVRMKKRHGKTKAGRERVNRTGRTYDDFQALELADKARVVQGDSVEGYRENTHDLLSLHIVARAFQLYLLKDHASSDAIVKLFDDMERSLGTPEAFDAVAGILLVDRGVEFDDWERMERSCLQPKLRRCRVYYCDPMDSNQKSQAERNHEQLRRILPKGRSDFDKLSVWDVAMCTSHVNSYPSAGRAGKCPFELLGDMLPKAMLDEMGVVRVAPDDVTLKPCLIRHAVVQ